jgi:hypothetical protein
MRSRLRKTIRPIKYDQNVSEVLTRELGLKKAA